ncbi:putative amidase-like protein [Phaeoacremonium minimum UCRPA7]|uniref:Putative amidase-like protein n=1 Tax=Phaeoacremonium minimum (strain UCR-PA7) TaxID=1286976 RepID=R8BGU0_PHAM7|nr:putative amidase-like protein [Phaeoacremonium minimum UCRPA7]EON98560.1 putative amidase-like protein [Phaeoacremonium minimum UCRPA7]
MAPNRRYANYPGAKESKNVAYIVEDDKNPVIRGLPVVIVSTIVAKVPALQRYLYANAGFGKVKDIPGLNDELWRFQPTVIPLADSSDPPAKLEIGPELYRSQPEQWSGRYYSVADYHEAYKSGKVTPLQVVEALLPLINREHKPSSEYSIAWLEVHIDEVLAAATASTERYAAGKPLGILDGVPVGVKCDIDMKGYVTSLAMKINTAWPYFQTPATQTVWPVEKLQEVGAIVVGQNNMHEVGMDTTGCNPTTGTPVNWFNKSYYPGGSSSGAGSALGAGLVPVTVGTDAGGSTRVPPCYAGCYSFKTSQNRTCTKNTTMTVISPMCSTVADLTIAYRLMAQPNPDDPIQGLFAPSVAPDPSAKKYIGLCHEWIARSSPVVLEVFNKAIDYYTTKLGYEVVDIHIPYLREGQLAHGAICLTEGADEARSRVPPGTNFLDQVNYPNKVMFGVGSQASAGDYLKFGQIRQTIMQHIAFLYEKYPGLLIVTPTMPLPGWKIDPGDLKYGFSDGNRSLLNMLYVWLSNMTGCPSLTAPIGYVDPEQGEGKLPIGILAMGEWNAEEQLLVWAGEAEKYLNEVYPGGRLKPKGWVDVLGLAQGQNGMAKASNGISS